MRLTGIVPPLVTPFRTDGEIDLAAFEANLDSYAEEDLAGYLVLGSNGEAASLDEGEKLALVAAARKRAGDRILLVGTGCESTRETIRLTRSSADIGADGVLVLTPHYYRQRMTDEALRRHFEAVADASPVPVFLYSVPVFTGIAISAALTASLAAHPRIAGIKDSSGDMGAMYNAFTSEENTVYYAAVLPELDIGAAANSDAKKDQQPRIEGGSQARHHRVSGKTSDPWYFDGRSLNCEDRTPPVGRRKV